MTTAMIQLTQFQLSAAATAASMGLKLGSGSRRSSPVIRPILHLLHRWCTWHLGCATPTSSLGPRLSTAASPATGRKTKLPTPSALANYCFFRTIFWCKISCGHWFLCQHAPGPCTPPVSGLPSSLPQLESVKSMSNATGGKCHLNISIVSTNSSVFTSE